MSRRFLLDTNIISERLRPAPNRGIVDGMRRHEGECATASPVWHELLYGCYLLPPSRRRSAIEKYLHGVVAVGLPILDYDAEAAAWHAAERARLSRAGKTPRFADGQIAAIAKVHDLEIITTNLKDYLPFEGIRIRDWQT